MTGFEPQTLVTMLPAKPQPLPNGYKFTLHFNPFQMTGDQPYCDTFPNGECSLV